MVFHKPHNKFKFQPIRLKMKTTLLFVLFVLLSYFGFGQGPDANGTLYVKKGETGNGNSWTNAMGELADALLLTKSLNETSPGIVKQIWVAGGTYQPLYSAEDGNFGNPDGRNNTFLLVDNVELYGGFEGTETSLGQRKSPADNESTLTGNLGSQAAYHVVVAASNGNESFTINGFTITEGNSIDIYSEELHTIKGVAVNVQHGAGLYANVSISIEQCKFTNNQSSFGGGVFLNAGGTAYAKINRNIFENNMALRGGGIYIGINAEVRNNLITGNAAIYMGGGGMSISGGAVKVLNNNITNNSSLNQWGGGIYLINGDYTIYNNYFQGNTHNLSDIEGTSYPDINYLQGTVDFDYNFVQKYHANTDHNITSGDIQNAGDPNSNTSGYHVQVGEVDFNGRKRIQGGRIDIGYTEATEYMPDENGIVYVNQNTPFDGDGSSWGYAVKDLAMVIKSAANNNVIKKIWVAKGTYLPQFKSAEVNQNNVATTNVSKTFVWTPDLQVFGGFSGLENPVSFDLNLRDFDLNETILSGNLNGNNVDNAQHIIIGSGDLGSLAEINGFTIANAQTSGGLSAMDELVNGNLISSRHGAGIYLQNAAIQLKNIIIKKNSAINWAGGGYGAGLYFSAALPTTSLKLSNVVFSLNESAMGGAVYHTGGNVSYELVNFSNNTATARGGAMYNANTTGTIFNTVFKKNKVLDAEPNRGGGAIYNGNTTGTNIKFINSAFAENEAPIGGAMTNNGDNTLNVTLVNCTFYKNVANANTDYPTAAGVLMVGSPEVTISNSIFYGNIVTDADDVKDILPSSASLTIKNSITETYGTHGINGNMVGTNPMFADAPQGNYTLQTGSTAINAGDNSLYTATGRNLITDTDLAGHPRLSDSNIDMGAYESTTVLPIELNFFTAKLENNIVVLRWETLSEKSNAGFEIFRSADAKNYTKLDMVDGKGTTNSKNSYTWYDHRPLNGINYYKLVQKDKDGKAEELGIRPLTFSFNGEEVVLYPNPVKEKANIKFSASFYNNIILSDIRGKIIQQIKLNHAETEKAIVMSNIPEGIYLLKLQGNGKSVVIKIIKN